MATNQQRTDLLAVMCECRYSVPHPLGSDGCTVVVKPGNYGSWKPDLVDGWRQPRYPVAEIFAELAKHAPDRATRERYKRSAATVREANKRLR